MRGTHAHFLQRSVCLDALCLPEFLVRSTLDYIACMTVLHGDPRSHLCMTFTMPCISL